MKKTAGSDQLSGYTSSLYETNPGGYTVMEYPEDFALQVRTTRTRNGVDDTEWNSHDAAAHSKSAVLWCIGSLPRSAGCQMRPYMGGAAMFMWGFGWGSFADRGAAGTARRCLAGVGFLSRRLDETKRKSSRLS